MKDDFPRNQIEDMISEQLGELKNTCEDMDEDDFYDRIYTDPDFLSDTAKGILDCCGELLYLVETLEDRCSEILDAMNDLEEEDGEF